MAPPEGAIQPYLRGDGLGAPSLPGRVGARHREMTRLT